MLDKRSGTVAYAVAKAGGRLRIGQQLSAIVECVKYNPVRQAYETAAMLERFGAARANSTERPLTGAIARGPINVCITGTYSGLSTA